MQVRKSACLALASAVVAVLILLFLNQPPRPIEYKLSDGSILRVEKISFGKRDENFKVGGWTRTARNWVVDKLAKLLPGRFTPARISSWRSYNLEHTNLSALHVWMTRRDPTTGKYLSVNFRTAVLVDKHGCPFLQTQAGGYEDGLLGGGSGFSVGWFTFEAFPRREKNFRFRFPNNSIKSEADFMIPNPAPPPRQADWVAEPLPITKRDGDMAFTLADIKVEINHNYSASPYKIVPAFEVRERGQVTKQWQMLDMDLCDGSGNFASKINSQTPCLCPWEPVWKIVARFFGSEQSASVSNSTWVISGIKVPGEGEFVALDATNEVQGVAMKAIALAGTGNVTYANGKITQASPFENGKRANSVGTTSYWTNYAVNLGSITPIVTLETGPLSENQRLTVRATDDQGRQVYAQESADRKGIHYMSNRDTRGPKFLILDLPKDAKTVDLTFCIHNARTEEFIFKLPIPD